jgi:FlaG/FlaF family flagellin (archaellin)
VISVSGSTASFAWNAPTSGGPPTAYLIEAWSSSGLSNVASFSTGTPATSLSVGNVPAGTYFVRVRGQNAAGTGAASNEVMLVVSGTAQCTSGPSAPSGLSFGVDGSTATLSWNASAGSPASYLIEAGSSAGSADIAVVDTGTAATTLSATVGAETYFVRVLGQNACGTSTPSNEVVIAIP